MCCQLPDIPTRGEGLVSKYLAVMSFATMCRLMQNCTELGRVCVDCLSRLYSALPFAHCSAALDSSWNDVDKVVANFSPNFAVSALYSTPRLHNRKLVPGPQHSWFESLWHIPARAMGRINLFEPLTQLCHECIFSSHLRLGGREWACFQITPHLSAQL